MSRRLDDAARALDDYRAQRGDPRIHPARQDPPGTTPGTSPRQTPRPEDPPNLFSTIAAVTAAAGEVWKLEVLEAIVEVARHKPTLTVEDISPLCPPTIDMRALGGVMLEAQRRGYITKGAWTSSGRERHGRPVREWRSNVYRSPGEGEAGRNLQPPTPTAPASQLARIVNDSGRFGA